MNEEEQIKQILEVAKKLKGKEKNNFTGFTTRCKKCNQDVRSHFIGKTDEGVPSYLLKCGCK